MISKVVDKLKDTSIFRGEYLLFILFRYLNQGINAYLMFLIAQRVGPEAYGDGARSFILITYSGFVVLGANQVLVKWYSKSQDITYQYQAMILDALINVAGGILVFVGVLFLVDQQYAQWVALIASIKLVTEMFNTILRLQNKFIPLAISSIAVSGSLLLVIMVLHIDNLSSFFQYWAIFSLLGLVISGICVFVYSSRLYNRVKLVKITLVEMLRPFFMDGIKLAIIGVLAPLMNTLDKFILSYVSDDIAEIGVLQLGDNISLLIGMLFNTVIFLITPTFLQKLSRGEINARSFYYKGIKIYTISLIIIPPIIFLLSPILTYFFPLYSGLILPTVCYSVVKILISGLFMFNIIVIHQSKEYIYVNTLVVLIAVYALSLYLLATFTAFPVLYYPILSISALVLFHLVSFEILRRKQFFLTS